MSKSTLRIPPEFEAATTAERIDFVTRLWDEIVDSGEDVAVPDHHRKILDSRLRAYRMNPQPGKPWAEVRDGAALRASPLKLSLVRIRPEAEADVRKTVEWYEAQRLGLGIEFLLELDAAIERAALNPEAYAIQHEGARRVLVRRFPYGVYYVTETGAIEVFGVLHQHRVPEAWQSR